MRDRSPASFPARFEYRIFRRDLGWVRERLCEQMRRQEGDSSRDLYLVGSGADRNVEVRDGMLQLKRLRDTHGALELWDFVGSISFPLAAVWVSGVLAENLGADSLRAPRERCSLPLLLREVIGRQPSIHAVEVDKRRERFASVPVIAEFVRARVDGAPLASAAVESPNPEAADEWVRRLALDRSPNTSYVRWLRSLAQAAEGQRPSGDEGARRWAAPGWANQRSARRASISCAFRIDERPSMPRSAARAYSSSRVRSS